MTLRSASFLKLLLVSVLVLAGCSGEPSETIKSGTSSGETVILRVGNRFLTGGELNRETDRLLETYRSNKNTTLNEEETSRLRKQFSRRVLRKKIVNFLLLSAAWDEGVSVNDEAVETRWQSFRDNVEDTRALETHLKEWGRSRGELKKQLEQNLILEKYLKTVVSRAEPTNEQLRNYFRENRDQFATASDTQTDSFEELRPRLANAYRIRSQERQLRDHLSGLWDRYDVELQGQSISKNAFFEELERPASLVSP